MYCTDHIIIITIEARDELADAWIRELAVIAILLGLDREYTWLYTTTTQPQCIFPVLVIGLASDPYPHSFLLAIKRHSHP